MANVTSAGSDTASSSLTWFLLYIVLHPEVHEALDIVTRKDRSPYWNDARNVQFLQATLCKLQRVSGMIGVVGTNAIQDMKIVSYHIPKGTFVAVNLAKLQQNERELPEPEKLKPEGFRDSDGKVVGWRKHNGFALQNGIACSSRNFNNNSF